MIKDIPRDEKGNFVSKKKKQEKALKVYEITETYAARRVYHVLATSEQEAERFIRCTNGVQPVEEEIEENEVTCTNILVDELVITKEAKL